MQKAGQWIAIVAGVIALIFALNWATQRGARADPKRVDAAEEWLRSRGKRWSLHDCQRQATSPSESTIQCAADTPSGGKTVYASFDSGGTVVDVCSGADDTCTGFRPPR